jgi:hypothetical protein
VFAEDFDELPVLFPGRDEYRYLVASGVLVRAATVTAQLVDDGSVVLLGLDVDSSWPE